MAWHFYSFIEFFLEGNTPPLLALFVLVLIYKHSKKKEWWHHAYSHKLHSVSTAKVTGKKLRMKCQPLQLLVNWVLASKVVLNLQPLQEGCTYINVILNIYISNWIPFPKYRQDIRSCPRSCSFIISFCTFSIFPFRNDKAIQSSEGVWQGDPLGSNFHMRYMLVDLSVQVLVFIN